MSYLLKLRITSYFGLICGAIAALSFGLSYIFVSNNHILNNIVLSLSSFFIFLSFLTFTRELSLKSSFAIGISFIVLLVIVLMGALSCLPPIARDELNQHLALPKLYLQHGRIVELPFATYTYYPMLVNMLYLPFISMGFDSGAKFLQLGFTLSTASLVAAYLSHHLNKIYGILGALIFLSTPIVFRTGTTAYVDLALTFYCTASLLAFLQYRQEKKLSWLVLSVLLSGCCAATKPNGGVIVIILGLIWFLGELRDASKGKNRLIGGFLIFGLLSVLFCLPWFVRNYISTGNPFFPFLNSVFGSPTTPSSTLMEGYQSIDGLSRRFLIYGENIWQVLALPIRIFLFGKDDSPREFDGLLNPILLLFLPFAFKNRKDTPVIFSFSLAYLLVTTFFTVMRVRYLLPIIPFLSILAVLGIENVINKGRSNRIVVVILFTICLGLNFHYIYGYFNKYAPLDFLKGNESREALLARILPDYTSIQFINNNTPSNSRIYMILTGRQGYYLNRDYFFDMEELPEIIHNALSNMGSAEKLSQTLKERSVTHILMRNDLFIRFAKDNFETHARGEWNLFITRHVRLLFTDKFYSLYELSNPT